MTSAASTEPAAARDPRAEAAALVGDGFDVGVLEPSPPAVTEPPWLADDPVAPERRAGTRLLSPVPGADVTWEQWVAERPQHAGWAAARWLAARRRLGPPPASLGPTRLALHRLAAFVVAEARWRATGKIGLRWTCGGFGTPFFGDDEQVRVEGARLVVQRRDGARSQPLSTLDGAAQFVLGGPPAAGWAQALGVDVPGTGPGGDDLGVDPGAAAYVADLYGFGAATLETLRAECAPGEASRLQLWPEHFDLAFDCGPDDPAGRGTFGVSPGDDGCPQPYLYASPWDASLAARDPQLWDATTFTGAALPVAELAAADDQVGAALAWWRSRRAALDSGA